MKKIMEKIISVALAVVSLFFVILILVTMYGGIEMESLSDPLVRALIFIMFGAFVLLSVFNIWTTFIDDEKLSDVLLFKDRESATKATVGVVKKTAKRVCKNVEEAKIRKVILHSDASGNISMNIEIKIKSDETLDVVTKVRALIIQTFDEVFGIEFASINFKVIKSKNTYVPTDKDVDTKVQELKASVKTNKLPENKVQTSTVTGNIPADDKEEVIEVTKIAEEENVLEAEEQLKEIQNDIYEAEDAAIDRKAAEAAEEIAEEEIALESEDEAVEEIVEEGQVESDETETEQVELEEVAEEIEEETAEEIVEEEQKEAEEESEEDEVEKADSDEKPEDDK
ncbi:MAG TPA: hypothetical protein PKX91_06355 [Clostridia bacterium]|jgi:hypothetical protein|nr:hypothetical protein [Clostridia bacterium]